MAISKDDFENIIKKDSIKCLTYVSKFKKLFDSYYDNEMFELSFGKCQKFLQTLILKKQI